MKLGGDGREDSYVKMGIDSPLRRQLQGGGAILEIVCKPPGTCEPVGLVAMSVKYLRLSTLEIGDRTLFSSVAVGVDATRPGSCTAYCSLLATHCTRTKEAP